MVTHAYVRCQHCQVGYSYQSSGEGCHKDTNDSRYCPDCKQVVLNALATVPKRVEKFWINYDGMTLDDVKRELETIEKEGRWKRVAVPCFDMNDCDNHNITGYLFIDGKTIFYSFWTKKNDTRIELKMERNLETGEESIWRNI